MHLSKHHGLGNDFLVAVDLDDASPIDAGIAVAVCDRHRGVGADGLIRVTRGPDAPFAMELRNDDGSRAEMSGNGISCLAQALVRAGHAVNASGPAAIDIVTDAGPRRVEVVRTDSARRHHMRVAMGVPQIESDATDWLGPGVLAGVFVDVGNPHLVLHVDDDAPDLVSVGVRANEVLPAGANVEFVRSAGDGRIEMQVYERGVGPTQACGTGAVAAALAANAWGLAEGRSIVAQPGGDAVVEIDPDDGPAHLTVPVVAIADIDWTPLDG